MPRRSRLQRRLTPIAQLVSTTHGVAGLKAALDLVGYRGGPVRAPLLPVPDRVRGEIAQAIEAVARHHHASDRLIDSFSDPGRRRCHRACWRPSARPPRSHLDPELVALLDDIRTRLAQVFRAPSGALTLAISGTGTSGMEAVVGNLTQPGSRALAIVTGYFGARLADCCRRYGADVTTLDVEWGRAVDPADVKRALEDGRSRSRRHRARGDIHGRAESRRAGRPARARAGRDHHRRRRDVARRHAARDRRVAGGRVLFVLTERAWRAVGTRHP